MVRRAGLSGQAFRATGERQGALRLSDGRSAGGRLPREVGGEEGWKDRSPAYRVKVGMGMGEISCEGRMWRKSDIDK